MKRAIVVVVALAVFTTAVVVYLQQRRPEHIPMKYRAVETVRDCPDCPEMVVVPAGSFEMGSPEDEEGRESIEGPQHRVEIGKPFAVGKYEVTRSEFETFAEATGRGADGGCQVWMGSKWKQGAGKSWRDPGFKQTDRDPVVCVTWEDARAYTKWLSDKTGESYRLPSEAEWEYAARGGSTQSRFWGDEPYAACFYANGADLLAEDEFAISPVADCRDGYVYTAPAGSFGANQFGLNDMLGNVWEWLEDCWNERYEDAPKDGRAWMSGDCTHTGLRGGSWLNEPRLLRSAFRDRGYTLSRYSYIGFRVAKTLP